MFYDLQYLFFLCIIIAITFSVFDVEVVVCALHKKIVVENYRPLKFTIHFNALPPRHYIEYFLTLLKRG